MRGAFRLAWAMLVVAIVSLVLVPPRWLGLKTGWFDAGRASVLWHRAVLWALGWRLRAEGRMSEKRPLLVVANHISWADILVLGTQGDVVFVAKSEVAGWPVIGPLARMQRTIFVERERRNKASAQAGELAGRLRASTAAILFAEGTTADGNHLLPFKSSLFGALAIGGEVKVFVQPATIAYTTLHGIPMDRRERHVASWIGERSLWFHLKLLARHGPLDVALRWGEPLEPGERFSRKVIAASAQAVIRDDMAALLRGGATADGPEGTQSLSKPPETR